MEKPTFYSEYISNMDNKEQCKLTHKLSNQPHYHRKMATKVHP